LLLTAVSIAWILGIFLGYQLTLSPVFLTVGIIPLPFIFFFRKDRKILVSLSLTVISLISGILVSQSGEETPSLSGFYNKQVEITGTVTRPPEKSDTTTHIELSVEEIILDGSAFESNAKILLFLPHYPEYSYLDTLRITGTPQNPPVFSGFDYQAYLAQQDIYAVMYYPEITGVEPHNGFSLKKSIYTLRENLADVLKASLPEPQAALAQGIVLGIRSSIPDDLRQELSVTGTAHLLAISGINLSIIAAMLISIGIWLFGRRYYLYVWPSLALIWFYAVLVGFQPPVVRAAVMASVFLLAEVAGRQKRTLVVLCFSAAVMTVFDPGILRSLSFQLSFFSMMGIVTISPYLQQAGDKLIYSRLLEESAPAKFAVMIKDSLAVSLAAVLAIWPLIAYHFGIISLAGPVCTLLIAPVLAPIIVFGSLAAFAGLVFVPLAQVLGWIAWLFLSYMLVIINIFASFSISAVNSVNLHPAAAIAYYAVFILLVFFQSNYRLLRSSLTPLLNKFKENLSDPDFTSRKSVTAISLGLAAAALLTTFAAVAMPDDDLHVAFLDVGQGDAVFIRYKHQTVLIDGGPEPQKLILELGEQMPFWERNIDLVVLTHPHDDHINGLVEVLDRYRVEQVLSPAFTETSGTIDEWYRLIAEKNITLTSGHAGERIDLENGVFFEVLSPPPVLNPESSIDNNGLVMRLQYENISFLFTADTGKTVEDNLITQRSNLESTVLKAAHHGSSTSTSQIWLNVVDPQVCVISVGENNTYGHPNEEVLERLSGIDLYRTDLNGTIEFTTDGTNLWVKTEK